MVFTVLGAVAELERSLIAERVKAGLRNRRAKGKRLGRPRAAVDAPRITALRARGRSWREITAETGTTRERLSGRFSACPKTYESRALAFLSHKGFAPNHLGRYGGVFEQRDDFPEGTIEHWFRSSAVIVYPVGSLCFLLRLSTWFSLLFGTYCSEIVPKTF